MRVCHLKELHRAPLVVFYTLLERDVFFFYVYFTLKSFLLYSVFYFVYFFSLRRLMLDCHRL